MSVRSLRGKPTFTPTSVWPAERDPFSTNKVTRFSLNFPIIGTCRPTKVCSETCYFSKGPATWSNSLQKQHDLLAAVRRDPERMGRLIAKWAVKHGLSFVRWMGGGDLFRELLSCIDVAAVALDPMPQWVVSRKPELASAITPRHNVYVHLSTDRTSRDRLDKMRAMAPAGLKWFFSYQCDKGEAPMGREAPVIFRDGYDLRGFPPVEHDCALNLVDDITGVCETCRRCFSDAVLTFPG